MLTRRGLIGSLISLAAAPAIVRASSLMPVKVMEPIQTFTTATMDEMLDLLRKRIAYAEAAMIENIKIELFGDRFYGISGNSANIYVSEPWTHKQLAVEIDLGPR